MSEIEKISFCKVTSDKQPEDYLVNILMLLESKRTLDDYQIVFQNSTNITFEFIREIE